jgi:hypothetical protein
MGCNEKGPPRTVDERVAVLNAILWICGSRGIGYTTSELCQFPFLGVWLETQMMCFLKTLKVQKS